MRRRLDIGELRVLDKIGCRFGKRLHDEVVVTSVYIAAVVDLRKRELLTLVVAKTKRIHSFCIGVCHVFGEKLFVRFGLSGFVVDKLTHHPLIRAVTKHAIQKRAPQGSATYRV